MQFVDRTKAGKALGEALLKYRGESAVVYALPRGGVVVGAEVARALSVPLDIIIARKIGHPSNPEVAVCAVTEDNDMLCDESMKQALDPTWFTAEREREHAEALRRRKAYLPHKEHMSAKGKTAIVVDDGIATGLTIRAAVRSLRHEKPQKIIVAVPVAPEDAVEALQHEADDVLVLDNPRNFLGAVGAHYEHFPQVSEREVIAALVQH